MFDQLDYKIIRELDQDSRTPSTEIARKLGVNERTIRKRIDRLVESGAIHPTIVVDPAVFNYVTSADIFLEVDPRLDEEVMQKLLDIPEISYIAFELGNQEVSVEARFKSNAELYDFVREKLGRMQGVKVTRFVLVPRILKNAHQWLPKPEDFKPPA